MNIDKTNDELLAELVKKVDKLLAINTKIAKCLHLLPVTEREEREIQLTQRKNLALAAKVNEDLNSMEEPKEEYGQLSFGALAVSNVFTDVLGDEFLPKD